MMMGNTKIRLIIFFAAKDGVTLYSQQKQDQELTVTQIMNSLLQNSLELKKVGKTTRPFRYGLNQIPYDYRVEVTNRSKGLDLTDSLKNYGESYSDSCNKVTNCTKLYNCTKMYKDRCTRCNDSSTKLQPQSRNDSCNKVAMTKLLCKDSCTLWRTMDRFTMTDVTNLQTVQ